jgi:hypothetical protein
MAGRQLIPLILSDLEQFELKSLVARRKTAQAVAMRARVVLVCAEGLQNKEAMTARLGSTGKWPRLAVPRLPIPGSAGRSLRQWNAAGRTS